MNVGLKFKEDLQRKFAVDPIKVRVEHLRQRLAGNQKLDRPELRHAGKADALPVRHPIAAIELEIHASLTHRVCS